MSEEIFPSLFIPLSCVFGAVQLPGLATMTTFTESIVEDAALAWLESLGWSIAHGSDIAWYTRSA